MKPAEARRLAGAHSLDELRAAAEAIAEELEPAIEVRGDDHGERLTHVLLASRIRERIERGEDLVAAFRAVMSGVRDVLTND